MGAIFVLVLFNNLLKFSYKHRDEDTDNIHSIYVDQWDWEKVISKEERNMETLQYTVRKVYSALKETEDYITGKFG